ncbi:riboflavin biosynthesis protein RibD domain-containing protein [Fusarium oxysporum f. sp. melonis 26406]|uniref:Riboflavin biosynthesis protein RibD domain-containing protein n=1 Tax=Fusarium oxysporum f. sp. melonis 26406 TaxID=1089452 RepID=W9ZSF0_FUSOX|nr:riboflavin biosynthesis protein RibD domain-containing protein [Fusarium oxysporum f. sp. melonis 26406]
MPNSTISSWAARHTKSCNLSALTIHYQSAPKNQS